MASSIDNLINVAFRKGQDLSGFGLKVGGKGDYRPPQFDAESLKFEYIDANESYGIDLNGSRFLQKLTFAESQDFTRATTGTFIGSNGLIQTAAIDAPRFTHDPVTREVQGLLIEEQRTNVITRSQPTVADNYWQALTDTTLSDVTLAGLPALRVTRDTGTGGLRALITNTQGNPNNECFRTMIVRVSDPANQYLKLRIAGVSGNEYYTQDDRYHITFDLSSKTVVYAGLGAGTAEIKELSVGVFKLTLNQTSTNSSAVAAGGWAFRLSDQSDASDYNTPQVPQGSWFEFTACQREELVGFPTSYIPTAGTQVTRAADNCVRVLGDEYNASEGTIYCELTYPVGAGGGTYGRNGGLICRILPPSGASFTNQFVVYRYLDELWLSFRDAGRSGFDIPIEDSGLSISEGVLTKIAVSWKAGVGFTFSVAGATSVSAFSDLPAFASDYLLLTTAYDGSEFSGIKKDFRIFPTALSDDELITLTGGT